jgi:hypothetical protein
MDLVGFRFITLHRRLEGVASPSQFNNGPGPVVSLTSFKGLSVGMAAEGGFTEFGNGHRVISSGEG